VEMSSEDDANNAIAQFNGQEYDGRNMVVNEARPREDRGGGGGGWRPRRTRWRRRIWRGRGKPLVIDRNSPSCT
jgi:RNA recognition motif-containing protein